NAIDIGADIVETDHVIAHSTPDAGERSVFAKGLAQRPAPFAGRNARFGALDRGRHDVGAAGGGALEFGERLLHGLVVALRAAGLQLFDLPAFRAFRPREDGVGGVSQRRRLALEIFVNTDDNLVAAFDRFQPRRV